MANDMELHINLLDMLGKGDMYTIKGMTDELKDTYHMTVDEKELGELINDYYTAGILLKVDEDGKSYYYESYDLPNDMAEDYDGFKDAVMFYKDNAVFGTLGDLIAKRIKGNTSYFDYNHNITNKKVSYETIINTFKAIREKRGIEVGNDAGNKEKIIPVKIYVSTRHNDCYIVAVMEDMSFKAFDMKEYKVLKLLNKIPNWNIIADKFKSNEKFLWGIEGVESLAVKTEQIRIIMNIEEYYEQSVIDRIEREKRYGELERIGNNTYSLTFDVSDVEGVVEWIRTFTGRIVMVECADKSFVKKIYSEFEKMYKMYY
ncbi:MAG: hypothetical protein K6G26_13760 [Lachnospiraceae bacterium]|nr:hypothetical protein [Lachnospiraceae bacterium]